MAIGRPRVADDSVQVSIRVSRTALERADAIAEQLTRDGYSSARADVFRAAIEQGLALLEKRHGIKRPRGAGK